MSEEIKPCPFCGGEEIYGKIEASGRVRVVCFGCLASTGWLAGADEAAAAWNRRAERTCRNESDPPTGFLCSSCGWGDFNEPTHLLTGACYRGGGIANYCPNCGARVVER